MRGALLDNGAINLSFLSVLPVMFQSSSPALGCSGSPEFPGLRYDKLVLVVLFTALNIELSWFFASVLSLSSAKPANTQCSLEAEGQPEGSPC